MYRRPKFLEVLLQIRQEMSDEANNDVELFAENVRTGNFSDRAKLHDLSLEKELREETRKLKKAKI
jgi:hypothetical protein